MKFMLLFFCVIAEAYAFPTQTPVEKQKPCRAEQPKLVYQGHDTKHGINVFVFEFKPVVEETEMKDEKIEYTTEKNGLTGEERSLISIGNEELSKDTTETVTPVYTYETDIHIINKTLQTEDTEKNIFPSAAEKPMNSIQKCVHMTDFSFDTINGQDAQNDTDMYGDGVLLSTDTEESEAETAHKREVRKTNGPYDVDGYYSTEGSTLIDISGYNESHIEIYSTVYFPSSVDGFSDPLDCTDGLCGNSSNHIGDLVTQQTIQNEMYSIGSTSATNGYTTKAEITERHPDKWTAEPTKLAPINRGIKKPDKSYVKDTESTRKYSNRRNRKFSTRHRQWNVRNRGIRHRTQNKRHSSSESDSDSSQEFD